MTGRRDSWHRSCLPSPRARGEGQGEGPGDETRPASELLREHRRDIVDKVHYWTGVRRTLVRTLVLTIEKRLDELQLVALRERSRQQMVELTVYITTLSMTFLMGKQRLRHRRAE